MKLVVTPSSTLSLPVFQRDFEENNAPNLTTEKECKIIINMANKCNLKCQYCFASHGTYNRTKESLLSIESARAIVKDIRAHLKTVHKLIFFGGEPLLNIQGINYICEKLSTKVKNFYIVTNGTILTDEVIQTLKKYNIFITISYDGVDNINNLYRGKGTAQKTKLFIDACLKAEISPQNLAILTVFTPEHLKQKITKTYLKEEINRLFPGITFICQEVNNTSNNLAEEFHFSQAMKQTLNDEYEANLSKALIFLDDNDNVDGLTYWPDEMFNIIRTFLFKERKINFCPDMGKQMMAYDFDGTRYVCQMFWGNDQAKHLHEDNFNAHITNLNLKENYSQCSDCWVHDFCISCVKGMGIDSKTNLCSIDDRKCKHLKNTVDKILSRLAVLYHDQEKTKRFEKKFIKNFDYQNATYFA